MRIISIRANNIEPIKTLAVENLSDVVVFAGPNGVGKSRLIQWLLSFFQNLPSNSNQWVAIEATCEEERVAWGKSALDTRVAEDAQKFRQHLQQNRRRAGQVSSILNFESNRSITQIQPFAFTWDMADPFEEMIGWNFGFNALSNRFTDTVHSIFRKVRSRREAIALKVEQLIRESSTLRQLDSKHGTIQIDPSAFPDPLEPFKRIFSQLLAPKSLVDPEAVKQQLFYKDEHGREFPITSLSSGEREVVNVAFDFLLRNPSDCIVFFDEPELHLHPELSYKLLQTLLGIGVRNQFIFCTHSAEIISASLDYSVVFISPPRSDASNQAIMVRENDDTHQALKLLGQSIGIVSLGKRIVLIEGEQGSLDKQTYGAILTNKFPNLVLVPSGGKGLIQSFGLVQERVLEKTIWGVQFFMLCDRDAVPSTSDIQRLEHSAPGRVKVLERYHLENYFLDENVIARVFKPIESEGSWLRDPAQINARLLEIARSRLSHAAALIVSAQFREVAGNVSILPSGSHGKSLDELIVLLTDAARSEDKRLTTLLQDKAIKDFTTQTFNQLEASLLDGNWKKLMPGRPILNIFCSGRHANLDFGRFKIAYLREASAGLPSPFLEIENIFASFAQL